MISRTEVNVPIVLIAAVGVMGLTSCAAPRTAMAKTLLLAAEQASIAIESQASASTVVYITRRVTERQLGSDLTDPYHLPVAEYVHYWEEVWITGDDGSLKTRMRKTDIQGNLLFDTQSVKAGESVRVRINDLSKGVDVVAETTVAKVHGAEAHGRWFDSLPDREFQVSQVTESNWKRSAWRIELERNLSSSHPSLLPDADRAAGLNAIKLRYVWIIDRDSSMTVEVESFALTESGEVLLSRMQVDPPRVLGIGDLPNDWFSIPAQITGQDRGDPVTTQRGSANQKTETIYAPSSAALAELGFEPFAQDAYLPSGQNARKGTFDILTAANDGLAALSVFNSTSDDSKFVTLLQGPADPLVAGLKSRPPDWTRSEPVTFTVEGANATDAWLVSGGLLSNPPSRMVVIFRHDGLLFYVIGQSLQPEELLAFVSSLTRIEQR